MRAPMEGSRKRWDDVSVFAFTATTGRGRKPAATVLSSTSIAESYDEHPPKRQQQAADAKAPEITPFTSQAP
ncbi:hypothetical protein CG436_13970 [Pantoea ananatis]|nr:hypothetical protein CG436_13970 [Pantoea ananatis]